ncbi:adhesion G protein-coupled receptor E3 [Danio aesculapii]|uniref:adhesion G protein-coupled receptor E3 n=1 Tax=Danio aesculapii TaxID=1142201 RepID=UPI0024C0989B|nr:adhesion G protein-coupled receptor E3 [Danio aesculapii]
MCDTSVSWSGWYRLFINGLSAQIPDTCVDMYSCGTAVPLWISGGHPTVEDGIVNRSVCSQWCRDCCYNSYFSIRVKACPGNYSVYELISPLICSAYCADVHTTLEEICTDWTAKDCLVNILELVENITVQVLPLNTVTNHLDMVLEATERFLVSSSSDSSAELTSYGNRVLQSTEKLISTLVKPTDTSANVSFTLEAVEGQVFMVGPNVTLDEIPRLNTTNAFVDIDLIGIAKNNKDTRSAAVAFMSYTTMENLLKADFFNTQNNTNKTMMSTVISATLPKTSNTTLTKAVNFTFRHIREFDPSGSLSCVYWNISEWIVDGCSVLNSNSSHTVCSCVHLSTFALIMKTSSSPPPSDLLDLLDLVCVIVGLVFFSLALLSFALCQWSPGINNVARINICISLLSAHLLFLLTQQFLSLIRPQQVLCVVIAGLLHFLFLSAFVWMFIEAVLLFFCVKNLSQVSSKKKEVLSSGFLCVIGYVVALIGVSVSIGLVPEGYGSEQCWIKIDKGFFWSFLGPVCVILALNVILFISIGIYLNSALKKLNAEVSQLKQTKVMVFKTLGQFVVLGCPWILGFFTDVNMVVEIVFLILNSQQGTFIFLIYCVLSTEIRQQYRKIFTCLCCGRETNNINTALKSR